MKDLAHRSTNPADRRTGRRTDAFVYAALLVCIYLLTFEEPVTRLGLPVITVFRNLLPVAGIAYFLIRALEDPAHFHALLTPWAIFGAVFAVSGMIGWIAHRYQTFLLSAQAMYEHLRFWICLYLFFLLFRRLPLKTYAKKLFFHVSLLSALTAALCAADALFAIWPRQNHRHGIGSLQIFYGHPSNLAAHAVFLLAMLCILYPYLTERGKGAAERVSAPGRKNERSGQPLSGQPASRRLRSGRRLCLVLILLLLLVCVMTLRIRMFGFVIFFAVLFLYLVVFKRRLNLPVVLIGIAGAFAVGWRRLYDFYFSPFAYTMARGQFAVNSLDLARKYFPFGSGFGTFGSRIAQLNYSPVYYQYHMMTTPGMSPLSPSYACDTFFPCILGESGWLGLIAYCGLIALLLFAILRKSSAPQEISRYAVLASLSLLAFEMLEAMGTLAFSETYSVLIALALGAALSIKRTAP